MDTVLYGFKHINLAWVVLVGAVLGLKSDIVWWCALTLLIVMVAVELAHGAVMGAMYRVVKNGPQEHAGSAGTEVSG